MLLEQKHSLDLDSGKFVFIQGPCSVDSPELAQYTIDLAKQMGTDTIRMDLFKPRTSPYNVDRSRAYLGAREEGLLWLRMAVEQGITPATEVMLPEQAETVLKTMRDLPNKRLLLWNGARDTNHEVVTQVAELIKDEPWVSYALKNPWAADPGAWKGLVEWANVGGVGNDRILMIYRGIPIRGSKKRSEVFWEDAKDEKIPGIRMLFDPSHTSKSREEINAIAYEGLGTKIFDGLMVEMHPWPDWPTQTKTDPGLSPEQVRSLHLAATQPELRRATDLLRRRF